MEPLTSFYTATVPLRMSDYVVDDKFVKRVEELLAGRSYQVAWEVTGIVPNQWVKLMKGMVSQPTFKMLERLARLQDWATPTWVATGHYEDDDDSIDSVEALHAWDLKVAKQRLRHFERIMAKQHIDGLSPAELRAAAQAKEDMQRADDQGRKKGPPDSRSDTAA